MRQELLLKDVVSTMYPEKFRFNLAGPAIVVALLLSPSELSPYNDIKAQLAKVGEKLRKRLPELAQVAACLPEFTDETEALPSLIRLEEQFGMYIRVTPLS